MVISVFPSRPLPLSPLRHHGAGLCVIVQAVPTTCCFPTSDKRASVKERELQNIMIRAFELIQQPLKLMFILKELYKNQIAGYSGSLWLRKRSVPEYLERIADVVLMDFQCGDKKKESLFLTLYLQT